MQSAPSPGIMAGADDARLGEKVRGVFTSALAGSIHFALNFVGMTVLGTSAPATAAVTGVVSSCISYVLDIMLAKSWFVVSPGEPRVHLPYTDFGRRGRWLLRSLRHRQCFRFVITVIIETLTGLAILEATIRALDAHRVLMHWRYRNLAVVVAVSLLVFVVFGNILRFDWAYNDEDHPLMNMGVLMWVALTMLTFAINYRPAPNPPPPQPEPEPDDPKHERELDEHHHLRHGDGHDLGS